MAFIISKSTITLKIPPHFKGLTGKEWLVIELEAETPTEVSEKVAEHYVKSWSNKFSYANEPEQVSPLGNNNPPIDTPKEFEAIEFLEKNYDRIEEAVNELTEMKELFLIAKSLRLNGYHQQQMPRLKERIINDITKKKEQEEKIKLNKEAEE